MKQLYINWWNKDNVEKIKHQFYSVFSDEPPISDYPLCIIKKKINRCILGQNIAEKHYYYVCNWKNDLYVGEKRKIKYPFCTRIPHFFQKYFWYQINRNFMYFLKKKKNGKSKLQVPDTGTRVLDNTRPFLRSSIVSFWITPAGSKERKYHIFRQYWYTKNVPVFTNTGTFQYLGPELYFFQKNFQ